MDIRGIPVGFGFALAMEPDALRNFATLPHSRRSAVVERAKAVSGKAEMRQLIDALASGKVM